METKIVVGNAAKNDAFAIREAVFMKEQGYQDEFDSVDDVCIHVALLADGAPVGCARTFAEERDGARWVIGRVAVLPPFRNHGFGRMLVLACEEAAKGAGAKEMRLHAQARLEPWYESMGYARFGVVDYEDEGQPHVWMDRTF